MKGKSALFILALATVITITACHKDESLNEPISYRYFPMAVGDSLIYDVSLFDKDLNTYDSTYQLLERVESIFSDNQGRPTFRLERYTRKTATDPWIIYKVWTANLLTTSAEKKEDNITYVKLVFPVKLNEQWNGNAKNFMADEFDDYKIISIDEPYSSANLNFDSSLTVRQVDYDYGFEKRSHYEKYAAGVGMVYKDVYDSLQGSPGGRIFHYTESLISHNKK
ncbi:MAG: hypothetical protein JSS90_02790 [Bacteroidetes bacterium]|jgi:hypothetical protein|nr:hypothetical protein [Bacteroidota bacterium]